MKNFFCLAGLFFCLFLLPAGEAGAQTEQNDPPVQPEETASDYKNFSAGQRIGTWALNNFVLPGLGSYVVMRDYLGGTIQLLLGGAGLGLTVAGSVLVFNRVFQFVFVSQWSGENTFRDTLKPYIGIMIAGGVMSLANFIFNIVRSAAYDRPRPAAVSLAVLPGESGAGRVQLAYTLRY